ncbi:MAG: hypothetical protein JO281_11100 [Pseudonocardiales bacterium]|nr:hypothetical protein [Pseudonocardiales bacterium]
MDYSWFGRPSGTGQRNGYRFDHTFITTHTATIQDCRYLRALRETGLSDHATMTLTLSR